MPSPNHSPDPLHGVTLQSLLTVLVEDLGWEELARRIPVRCFAHDPSIKSSLTFLRKTPWARTKVDDPTARAAQEFARLKMHRTAARNGVLFLVAPDARTFAVFGDQGIHEKCGDDFWRGVAAVMESHFRAGDPTTALVEGIARAGELLATEFPRQSDDIDELPNQVITRPADD